MATEALMLYVELDKADPVIEEMLQHLTHKQPKVIAADLEALAAIVHAFGVRVVEPKPLAKILPQAYGHADKNVRAQAQALTVELYRWLKDAIKPLFWDELKPVQQSDLEKLFEKEKDQPAPKQDRLLKSQQAAAATAQDEDADDTDAHGQDVAEDEPELDLEPDLVAVDAAKNIPDDLDDRIASKKWSDRKEVLDEIFAAVNHPLLQDGMYDTVVRACAKSMKDANIAVVTSAANVITALAKGLRKSFAKNRNIILSPMLERYKEKKQTVTDALSAACDAVFSSTNLSDILEETLEFLKHKNPQVKQHSTEFLKRCLKTTKQAPALPEVKLIADAAKQVLGDSLAPTRDAGAETLGVLWKIMGDRNMAAHLDGIDDIKKNKIKEFHDSADVQATWKPAPTPQARPAPQARAAPGKRPAPGVKRPTAAPPARATSPFDENPGSMPARTAAKPAGKLNGPKIGSATPALKKPGLARPGTLGSPKRAVPASSSSRPADETQTRSPPRSLQAPRGGLAARSLAKPSAGYEGSAEPPAPAAAPASASFADLAELADLRAEAGLLRQQNADLRADKARLQSELHEIQDKHAQMIEDNTRITLSNKAKESQLIRSRFDMEEVEERASNVTRENERMKREIQRLEREGAAQEEATMYGRAKGRTEGGSGLGRPAYGATKTLSSHEKITGPMVGDEENMDQSGDDPDHRQRLQSAQRADQRNPESQMSRGLTAPHLYRAATASGGTNGSASANGHASNLSSAGSRNSSLNRSQTEGGVESWKRAAEVTQNLKARIELMKVSFATPTTTLSGC